MALTTCEECGRAISDRAVSCPQCGMPRQPTSSQPPRPPVRVSRPSNQRPAALVASVSIAAVLILILAVVLFGGTDTKKAPAGRPTGTTATPSLPIKPGAEQRPPLK